MIRAAHPQYNSAHRNAAVLKVLNEATGALTPTQIAELIRESWCCYPGIGGSPAWGISAAISPVLKRIKAVRYPFSNGRWLKPKE